MKKSILAKLLAKENITIQHGNYDTAWFDIKDRVLGLPLWKDVSNDVYDLLIGHEVGHALETPYEGWHESPDQLEGCPRSYINVIEDARIERKIKDRYAGLVGPMARGYKKLFEDGFFGKDYDFNKIKLIDKINLKAKVGAHLNVPFTDEEQVFMDRAMTTDSFDDVVDLVKDIYEWTKENQEELLSKPQPEKDENDQNESIETEGSSPGHDDGIPNEDEGNQDSNESESPRESDQNEQESNANAGNADDDSNEPNAIKSNVPASGAGGEFSETDKEFRSNERKLLETEPDGTQPLVINEMNKAVMDKVVIPYKKLEAARIKHRKQQNAEILLWQDYENYEKYGKQTLTYDDFRTDFATYMKEVKRNVNYAVKEFEMKKAAYRYTRAQTARTGSIDVNRLWSYKTNDDIFNRVTKLADAKNHGMMMMIDYSGSMSGVMKNVLDQVIHLSMFCKAVNIPFEVYSFTNQNKDLGGYWDRYEEDSIAPKQQDAEAHHNALALAQLTAGSLKKADFEESMYGLYARKMWIENKGYDREITPHYEEYGSTPLNIALMGAHRMVDKFMKKNAIENMNFVVISDGATDSIDVVQKSDVNHTKTDRWETKVVMNIMGRAIKANNRRTSATKALLENLQKQFGATTLGFFIANDTHQYRSELANLSVQSGQNGYDDFEVFKKAKQKEFSQKRCLTAHDVFGYNEYYVLKRQATNTEADEFEVEEDATKNQIRNAFKKHSKSKKNNKTLLTNFGKAVAL